MIWFDSDAEYMDYLKSKNGCGLSIWGWIIVGLIVFILAVIGTCAGGDNEDKTETDKEVVVSTKPEKTKSKTKQSSKTEDNTVIEVSQEQELSTVDADPVPTPTEAEEDLQDGLFEEDHHEADAEDEYLKKGYNPYAAE